jgi:succinate dehydrogenase/fumarate reductase flavoprotein subunit
VSVADEWEHDADVVVVGFGGAGCAAAIAAHDAGARVIVLEKMPAGREGGSTRVSGAVWFDNRDPARAADYLRNLSAGKPIPEPVVRAWAAETARNTDWLRGLGIDTAMAVAHPPEYPELDGSEANGGWVGVDGRMGGGLLYAALATAVRARGIEVLLACPARELIQDADGAVCGVRVAGSDGEWRVRARRGVVLTTGGFEGNREMVRDFLPLTDPVLWGSPAATGDGHKMAQRVGADLWHMGNMMTLPGVRVPGLETGFYASFPHAKGFIYVGFDGTRCYDETIATGHGHARIHGSYELFPTRPMHVVFDEATRRAGPIVAGRDRLAVGWAALVEGYDWSSDNSAEIALECGHESPASAVIRHGGGSVGLEAVAECGHESPASAVIRHGGGSVGLEAVAECGHESPASAAIQHSGSVGLEADSVSGNGGIVRADSIAELALALGVDPDALERTVARYNAACAAGVDDQFGRDPATLTPLVEPPFYGFTSGPLLAWTNGGPRRNERAEVLDPFGAAIPGLYAAGNVSSTYSWCKDGGFHIADALAFGRIAGRNAAAR